MSAQRAAQLTLGGLGLLAIAGIVLLITSVLQPGTPEAEPSTADASPGTLETSSSPSASTASDTSSTSSSASSPFGFAPQTPAEEAAVEAARVMTTWDPAEDIDPTASEARAKHLMTSERAAQVSVSDRGTADPEWMRAYRRHLVSEPTALIVPGGEGNTITVNVTWDWVTPDGSRDKGKGARTFYFTLTDDGDTPKVADYTWSGAF